MTDDQWNSIFDALAEDISDRRGLKWEWEKIDPDVMNGISAAWRQIVEHGLAEVERREGEAVSDREQEPTPEAWRELVAWAYENGDGPKRIAEITAYYTAMQKELAAERKKAEGFRTCIECGNCFEVEPKDGSPVCAERQKREALEPLVQWATWRCLFCNFRAGSRDELTHHSEECSQHPQFKKREAAEKLSAERERDTRRRCIEIAEQISTKHWKDYKHGENRADPHYQGLSDGASEVAEAIRAMQESAGRQG